jgi:dTMP kinase
VIGRTYSYPLPGHDPEPLPGKLVVIEGTDVVGRSTQIAILREWLEAEGFGVATTGFARSALAGQGLRQALTGHTLDEVTMALFYCTDFADRLERDVIPALRAGQVVLADRYLLSLMARSMVRGVSLEWLQTLYGFALRPDLIVYLKADVPSLVRRVVSRGRGFDWWESGLDFLSERSPYRSFQEYQGRVLAAFERLGEIYPCTPVVASGEVLKVNQQLREVITPVIGPLKT